MRRFEQARSPAGHQEAPPRQLAESPVGAAEHGAANHVRLLGESAPALGGQTDIEHGVDPTWHVALQPAADAEGKIEAGWVRGAAWGGEREKECSRGVGEVAERAGDQKR